VLLKSLPFMDVVGAEYSGNSSFVLKRS